MPKYCFKLDGFVVIARNWNFLPKPEATFQINTQGLFVNTRSSFRVKCSETFKNTRNLHCIRIGNLFNFELNFVFFNNNPTVTNITYRNLLSLIHRSFESAMEELRASYPQSSTAKAFIQNVGLPKMKIFLVFPEDFHRFGDILAQTVNRFLRAAEYQQNAFGSLGVGEYNMVILAENMGQSISVNEIRDNFIFSRMDRSVIDEVIFHIAIDGQSNGHAAIWNRNMLSQLISSTPKEEYYSCGLGSHGNFVFNHDGDYIRRSKFYSEAFKHYHKNDPSPFKTPVVSDFLLSKATGPLLTFAYLERDETALEDVRRQFASIDNSLINISDSQSLYGRAEFIVVQCRESIPDGLDFMELVDVIGLVRDYFIGKDIKKALYYMPIQALHQHLQTHVGKAAILILEKIEKFRICSDENIPFNFSFKEYASVCAAEAIVCFFVYGYALHTNMKRGHCNELLRTLGLTSTFLGNNTLYPQFKYQIEPAEINFDHDKPMKWIFSKWINCNSIKFQETIEFLWLNMEHPIDLSMSKQETQKIMGWTKAARLVVASIIEQAVLNLGKPKGSTLSSTELIQKVYRIRKMISSRNFIEWLYGYCFTNGCCPALQNVIGFLDTFVKETNIKLWRDCVSDMLEDEMMKSGSFLSFAISKENVQIVLPMERLLQIDVTNFHLLLFDDRANTILQKAFETR